MASPSATGDESEPRVARFFSASRPPSPSIFPGFLNLEVVNDKLRQRTLSPETPSAERERIKARKPFDELVELGGIPLRPWIDFRAEDLTDDQRGDDDGEGWMQLRYMDEERYWQTQMRLWRRFAKRRSQDSESSLQSLEPVAAVTAFIAYLRGHLQKDMEDRVAPGCEIWSDYIDMRWHRDFIENIVKALPLADALLKQLRKDNGDEGASEAAEVTCEGLMEEYNVPDRVLWFQLWNRTQASLTDSELETLLGHKRQRDDANEDEDEDEDEEDPRPTKRLALSGKPAAEAASSSQQEDQDEGNPNAEQDVESVTLDSSSGPATPTPKDLSETETERSKPVVNKESTVVDNHKCEQPADTGEEKTAPITGTAKHAQEPRDRHSVPDSPGLGRSNRAAVHDPLSK